MRLRLYKISQNWLSWYITSICNSWAPRGDSSCQLVNKGWGDDQFFWDLDYSRSCFPLEVCIMSCHYSKLQPSPFLVVPTLCTLCANPLACLVPLHSAVSRSTGTIWIQEGGIHRGPNLHQDKDWHYLNTGRGYLSCMLRHMKVGRLDLDGLISTCEEKQVKPLVSLCHWNWLHVISWKRQII